MNRTPISYYGGKANLRKYILPLIPQHSQYIEPFFGGGSIFFAKDPSKKEVINDLDNRVINFYECLKQYPHELNSLIQTILHSEAQHRRAGNILRSGLPDQPTKEQKLEFAWAFYLQTNMSFSNKIFAGWAFGNQSVNKFPKNTHNKKINFSESIEELGKRFELVEIFNRDALSVIRLKDTPESFFYIDPPYFNSDCGHYKGYSEQDFINLLEVLSTLKGKFLLSSYDSNILEEFVSKNNWKQEKITLRVGVTDKRKEEKFKIEYLTFNS